MTKKLLKVLFGAAVLAMAALVFAVVTATPTAEADLPDYLGSEACLGCHVEKFVAWEGTHHAEMIVPVNKPTELPGDMNATTPEFKAELLKADWIVAGVRFLARDPATGELKYLNTQWNPATKQYVAYKGGSSWNANCAGCHATGYDRKTAAFASPGIGCENCHGPGKQHVLGKGDRSKIVVSTDSQVCGQCHLGGGTAKDGTRWAEAYRPGMNLYDYFNVPTVDTSKIVPSPADHWRQFPLWEASGHANATNLIIPRGDHYLERIDCMRCHSTAAGSVYEAKAKWDHKTMLKHDGVSCVACHDPHARTHEAQLKMEPQALCVSCHSIGRGNPAPVKIGTVRAPHAPQADMLWGVGALNVADTKGPHATVKCVECHMTEGNHLMQVLTPARVAGTTRTDSCSACHTNSSADVRGVYLNMWKDAVSLRLTAIDVQVLKIEEALKLNPNALTADEKKAFEQWRANFWYVRKDGSMGAHNFEYAIKVLSQTEKEILKLVKVLK